MIWAGTSSAQMPAEGEKSEITQGDDEWSNRDAHYHLLNRDQPITVS